MKWERDFEHSSIEARSTRRNSLGRLLLLSLVQMVANRKWPGMEPGIWPPMPRKWGDLILEPYVASLESEKAQKGWSKPVKLIKNACICRVSSSGFGGVCGADSLFVDSAEWWSGKGKTWRSEDGCILFLDGCLRTVVFHWHLKVYCDTTWQWHQVIN